MYRVQDWAEVHRLFHREGWSKTEIAEIGFTSKDRGREVIHVTLGRRTAGGRRELESRGRSAV